MEANTTAVESGQANLQLLHASDIPIAAKVVAFSFILMGYFFYCWNWVVIDYVRPYLVDDLGMTLNQTALLYSAESFGAIIGSFGTAWLASHYGQKNTLIVITLLNGSVTMINMMFEGFIPWVICRGILGLALGGYFVVAVSFMVLLCEQKYRGRLEAMHSSTFALSLTAMGTLGGVVGDQSWKTLMYMGGIPPLLIALAMFFLIPNDKKIIGYGESSSICTNISSRKASWGEMFRNHYAKLTILCLLLAGTNLAAYQFFAGFITTYLKTERGFDASALGFVVAAQGIGSFAGGFFWAHVADTVGRRTPLIGFVLAAILICFYFIAPANPYILAAIVCGYGFCVSCVYAWGVYFAEIFPPHLKSMGASLFHGGRIISLFAPSAVALIADATTLGTGMMLAPVILLVAAAIWYQLPETLKGSRGYKGYIPLAEPAKH